MRITYTESVMNFKLSIQSGYHETITVDCVTRTVREYLKELKFRWDNTSKAWYTNSLSLYLELLPILERDFSIKWFVIPIDKKANGDVNPVSAITPDLKLRPSQEKEVNRLSKTDFGICGWEQGTGKMIIGCMLAKELLKRKIIIVPTGLVLDWYEKLTEWSYDANSICIVDKDYCNKNEFIDMNTHEVYLVTISMLERWYTKAIRWDKKYNILVDEVDKFRNPFKINKNDDNEIVSITNKKSYILKQLKSSSETMHWFTGTLINHSTTELINLVTNAGLKNMIAPLTQFREYILGQELVKVKRGKWGPEITAWSEPSKDELYMQRVRNFLSLLNYKRVRRDEILDLPDKVRDIINVMKLRYTKAEQEILSSNDYSNNSYFELCHTKALAKVKNKDFKTLFASLLDVSVVYYRHNDVLKELTSYLDKLKISYVIAKDDPHGNTKKFQNGEIDVIFAQAKGLMGYTWTRATNGIVVELADTPGEIVQAEDRVYRYGLDHKVIMYYLLDKDGADSRKLEMLSDKCDYLRVLEDDNADISLKGDLNTTSEV